MLKLRVAADVRYALRMLRRSPSYTATVIGVLALGLTLATVTTAVVDGALFKPLPYPRAAELALVRADVSSAPQRDLPRVSAREIDAWREALPTSPMSAVSVGRLTSTRSGRERISANVDQHFFDVLGIRPMLGGFSADDFGGAWMDQPVVLWPQIVSHAVWQREFGGDPGVVGRVVITRTDAEGRQYGRRIAGVLPPDFVLPVDGRELSDLGPLVGPTRGAERDYHVILRLGRTTPAAAEQALRAATAGLSPPAAAASASHKLARTPPFDAVRLVSVNEHLAARERPAFVMVFAASGILLLLASVNVAGLTAARNADRRADLAISRALGASTTVIVRGLLIEVGVLATAALGIAVLLARPMLAWTVGLLPASVSLLKEPALDPRVLAGSALLATISLAVAIIWPGIAAARTNPKLSSQAMVASTLRTRRAHTAVVAVQVALGFVLLTAGGLTIVSLAAAYRNDTGYRRDHAAVLEVFAQRPAEGSRAVDVLRALPAVISSVPGVQAVAVSTINPLFTRRANAWTEVVPEGSARDIRIDGVVSRRVSANFFEVLDTRLVDGRYPAAGEWIVDQPVAVVSQTAARILWPDRPAIGRRLVARSRPLRRYTVIGVVADARFTALDEEPTGDIYLPDPLADDGRTGVFFHLRTSAPASAALPAVLSALNGRGLLIEQAATHEDALFASVKHRVLPAWLFGTLGLSALVMLGASVLGLLAMSVAQRRREIGIRMALGASTHRVVMALLGEELFGVTLGILAGALCSAWTVRLLQSQLYGVTPYDPAVWLAVAACLGGAAVIGALLPSFGALRINPAVVLRDR